MAPHLSSAHWKLSARLGYAWRHARRDNAFLDQPLLEISFANLLKDVGFAVRPRPQLPPTLNLDFARPDARHTVQLLTALAGGFAQLMANQLMANQLMASQLMAN